MPRNILKLTFKVKEHIGLVVLEHLCDQLDVHVLDVDGLAMSAS